MRALMELSFATRVQSRMLHGEENSAAAEDFVTREQWVSLPGHHKSGPFARTQQLSADINQNARPRKRVHGITRKIVRWRSCAAGLKKRKEGKKRPERGYNIDIYYARWCPSRVVERGFRRGRNLHLREEKWSEKERYKVHAYIHTRKVKRTFHLRVKKFGKKWSVRQRVGRKVENLVHQCL